MKTMEIENLWLILFPGFYHTNFEPLNYDSNSLVDYFDLTEEQRGDGTLEKICDSFDFEAYKRDIATDCADAIESELCEELGVEYDELFSFSNPHIWSPREYNFDNDHLEINFTINDFERLHKALLDWCAAHKEYLTYCIKRDNTPCSGYTPFYSNKYDKWMSEWQLFGDAPVAFAELLYYIVSYKSPDDWLERIIEIDDLSYYSMPETVEQEQTV